MIQCHLIELVKNVQPEYNDEKTIVQTHIEEQSIKQLACILQTCHSYVKQKRLKHFSRLKEILLLLFIFSSAEPCT